jgi:hypothetical protein
LILLNKSGTYSSKKQKVRKINSIITLMAIILISNASIGQTIHDAKVQGIISIGSNDIASILDLNTGDRYKTTRYEKGLLTQYEDVQLEVGINENEAKIIKPNLNANIMAFKKEKQRPATNEERAALRKVNNSIENLKEKLDLVAKSLVFLMKDEQFTQIVANMALNNGYEVKISDILNEYDNRCINIMCSMKNSLRNSGISEDVVNQLPLFIRSFKVKGYTYEPRIFMTSLNESQYIKNDWNGVTPTYIATSLFYEDNIPTYRVSNGSIVKSYEDINEVYVRPNWYLSLKHDIDLFGDDGEPLAVYAAFGQIIPCKCLLTKDDLTPYCDSKENPAESQGACPDSGPDEECTNKACVVVGNDDAGPDVGIITIPISQN